MNCLNVIEDILLKPDELYEEMIKRRTDWNNERFLAHHLRRKGLLNKTKLFPYVMYAARSVRDESPTWRRGRYEPAAGHFVKYDAEYREATAFATVIRSRADWQDNRWAQFDPASAIYSPISLLRRIWYGFERLRVWMLSESRRPGWRGRLMRFYKELMQKTVRCSVASNEGKPSYDELSRRRDM
jgi:hypothetical protein